VFLSISFSSFFSVFAVELCCCRARRFLPSSNVSLSFVPIEIRLADGCHEIKLASEIEAGGVTSVTGFRWTRVITAAAGTVSH
jgi:hypothetical protein